MNVRDSVTQRRNLYRSETGRMEHVRGNVFLYGQTIVTKYLGNYCEATCGNALRFDADTEQELLDRIDTAGYGPNSQ